MIQSIFDWNKPQKINLVMHNNYGGVPYESVHWILEKTTQHRNRHNCRDLKHFRNIHTHLLWIQNASHVRPTFTHVWNNTEIDRTWMPLKVMYWHELLLCTWLCYKFGGFIYGFDAICASNCTRAGSHTFQNRKNVAHLGKNWCVRVFCVCDSLMFFIYWFHWTPSGWYWYWSELRNVSNRPNIFLLIVCVCMCVWREGHAFVYWLWLLMSCVACLSMWIRVCWKACLTMITVRKGVTRVELHLQFNC